MVVQVRDTSLQDARATILGEARGVVTGGAGARLAAVEVYPLDEFNVAKIGQQVGKFLAAERQAGRAYKVVTRPSGALGVRVALA